MRLGLRLLGFVEIRHLNLHTLQVRSVLFRARGLVARLQDTAAAWPNAVVPEAPQLQRAHPRQTHDLHPCQLRPALERLVDVLSVAHREEVLHEPALRGAVEGLDLSLGLLGRGPHVLQVRRQGLHRGEGALVQQQASDDQARAALRVRRMHGEHVPGLAQPALADLAEPQEAVQVGHAVRADREPVHAAKEGLRRVRLMLDQVDHQVLVVVLPVQEASHVFDWILEHGEEAIGRRRHCNHLGRDVAEIQVEAVLDVPDAVARCYVAELDDVGHAFACAPRQHPDEAQDAEDRPQRPDQRQRNSLQDLL
mmetsp:Transcript_168741/g.542291  ORF Transcript_168741/g.542291 Transcript_168741/m.542291 type:complete len:309 (-) Transcript_168741:553-1479(-)